MYKDSSQARIVRFGHVLNLQQNGRLYKNIYKKGCVRTPTKDALLDSLYILAVFIFLHFVTLICWWNTK